MSDRKSIREIAKEHGFQPLTEQEQEDNLATAGILPPSWSTPKASVQEFDEQFDEWFDEWFETFGLSLHDIAKAGAIQFMTARDVEKEM